MLVEVCANSLESALNAQKAGADRIELCTELGVGGVTPSLGLLRAVKEHIDIPVNVLIRPRSGDFTYSEEEFGIMMADIAVCVDMGFNGIVSGALHANFQIDVERTTQLIAASRALKFTFHRAFDWVTDPFEALDLLQGLHVDTILSSGQQKSAPEGFGLLADLHKASHQVTIMPGGGLQAGNIGLFKEIGFRAVHLSASSPEETLASEPKVSMNSPSFISDRKIFRSSPEKLEKFIKEVKKA
ncbi:MAG: copper homeostasis protein CutC [Flavobacteriaceae bacterium]